MHIEKRVIFVLYSPSNDLNVLDTKTNKYFSFYLTLNTCIYGTDIFFLIENLQSQKSGLCATDTFVKVCFRTIT